MRKIVSMALFISLAAAPAFALDRTGQLGVGLIGGVGIPIGDNAVRDDTKNGYDTGVTFRYVRSKNWQWGLTIENINVPDARSIRFMPVLISGIYNLLPEAVIMPVARVGVGPVNVRGVRWDQDSYVAPGLKLGGGLEYDACSRFSIGVYGDYLWAVKTRVGDEAVHVFTTGLLGTFWFGGSAKK